MIVASRLRKGSAGSARGAARLVADTLETGAVRRRRERPVLLRADSAFYGHKVVAAARRAKAVVSITVRQTRHIKAAISTIGDDAWTTIKYPTSGVRRTSVAGSPAPRSPKSPSSRSRPGRRASRSRAVWWSAGSPTST